MSSKSATASAANGREAEQVATVDGYLAEMVSIRRRMKSTDVRIRRADASIRRDLDEAWAILRHVQTVR
jgi:hypothetical protein